MKSLKKSIFLLIALACLFLMASCNNDKPKQGYDGREFDISLNDDRSVIAKSIKVGKDYELIISGKGSAKTYAKKELVPWNVISKKITKVTIEEGITNIGDYYFYSTTLQSFVIPSSVNTVEKNSFNNSAKVYSYSTEPIEVLCDNQIYYYSETTKTNGQYWHMVNGNPIIYKQYKILFIGNSFTYYPYTESNPGVVSIVKSITNEMGLEVDVDYVVKGAHTLKKFSDPTDEKGKIVEEKLNSSSNYDYVILQEQSTTPVNGYNNFKVAVETLLNKVNKTQENCEVILYATWGFPSGIDNNKFKSIPEMEMLIREAYMRCADELSLNVSHVGKAFTYVYENEKDINLYYQDDKHQSYAGAYLSACVHICTLFNIDVRNVEFSGEISNEQAAILRNVAYDIVLK